MLFTVEELLLSFRRGNRARPAVVSFAYTVAGGRSFSFGFMIYYPRVRFFFFLINNTFCYCYTCHAYSVRRGRCENERPGAGKMEKRRNEKIWRRHTIASTIFVDRAYGT